MSTDEWHVSRIRLLRARISLWWEYRREKILPWMTSEGEATARVVDRAFDKGFPMSKDYADLDAAVQHLQDIWNIVDNWDGSRLNVEWARNGIPKGWLHDHTPPAALVQGEKK